jgi:hypothetical protein
MLQSIGMLILHVAFHALGTELAAIEGEVFPGFKSDNPIVLNP